MSLLYQLRYFIRFCQISGVIPYSMKLVKFGTRGESKTIMFEFSWRQITSWWFSLIVSSNLISFFAIFLFIFTKATSAWDMPNIMFVTAYVMGVAISLQFASNRYMMLQPKKWNRVIRLMYKIDEILDNASIPIKTTKTINYQVIISVFLVTGLVSSF